MKAFCAMLILGCAAVSTAEPKEAAPVAKRQFGIFIEPCTAKFSGGDAQIKVYTLYPKDGVYVAPYRLVFTLRGRWHFHRSYETGELQITLPDETIDKLLSGKPADVSGRSLQVNENRMLKARVTPRGKDHGTLKVTVHASLATAVFHTSYRFEEL